MTNKMTLEIDLNNLAEVTKAVNQLIAIEQHLIMSEQVEGMMDTTVFNDDDLIDWEVEAKRVARINYITEVLLPHFKSKNRHAEIAKLITELNQLETR